MRGNWATIPRTGEPKRFSTAEHNARARAEQRKREEDAERWIAEVRARKPAVANAKNLRRKTTVSP